MTQEQLKEQFLQYADYNLNNETILQAITELLNNIANELQENGYTHEANRLTTSELIIKEVLKNVRITFDNHFVANHNTRCNDNWGRKRTDKTKQTQTREIKRYYIQVVFFYVLKHILNHVLKHFDTL